MIVLRTRNENRHSIFQVRTMDVLIMFSKIMTRLSNLSVHWLFVAANYSLRIFQRKSLVGQGLTGGFSQWKLSCVSLARTIHMELTMVYSKQLFYK